MQQTFVEVCIYCNEVNAKGLSIFCKINGEVCPVCGHNEFVIYDYAKDAFANTKLETNKN